MNNRVRRLLMLFLALAFAYGMGALTCYLIYPQVEVRPWVALPETGTKPVESPPIDWKK